MQQHVADLIRILYKRRWAASGVFLLVVAYGATNTLRKTPTYDAAAQLLIEDGRRAETSASAGTADSGGGYETQVRILRSRALAWDALKTLAMDAPPTPQESRELAEANARRALAGPRCTARGCASRDRAPRRRIRLAIGKGRSLSRGPRDHAHRTQPSGFD